uniref:Uncharacterized protein n=1 Tax=Globodera rostochiensis TaxID=31243 RepID=A0A914HMS6_GLORO
MNKWTAATQIVVWLLLLVVVGEAFRFPSVRLPFLRPRPRPPAAGVRPRLVEPQPFQARPRGAPAIPLPPANARPVKRIPSAPVAVHLHLAPVLVVPHYQQAKAAPEKHSTEVAKEAPEKCSTETAKAAPEKSSTEEAKAAPEKFSTEAAKAAPEKYSTETAKAAPEKSSTEEAKAAPEQPKTEMAGAVTEETKTEMAGAVTDVTKTEANEPSKD